MIQGDEGQSAAGEPVPARERLRELANDLQAAANPASPSTVPIVNGRLAADAPCLTCGYNLRSLTPEGHCPECGTPVGISIRGGLLRFADPRWVATLASGMNWIIASIVLGIALGCLGQPLIVATGLQRPSLLYAVFLMPRVMGLRGYWKFTTPDPRQLADAGGGPLMPVMIRFLMAGALGLDFLTLVLLAVFSGMDAVAALPRVLSFLMGVGGFVLFGLLAQRLARRIPAPSLVTSITWLMRGYAAFVVGAIAMFCFMLLMGGNSWQPIVVVSSLVFVVYISLSIWLLLVLIRLRRAMSDAASDAEQSWKDWMRTNPGAQQGC